MASKEPAGHTHLGWVLRLVALVLVMAPAVLGRTPAARAADFPGFEDFAQGVCGNASGSLGDACRQIGGGAGEIVFESEVPVPSPLATALGLDACEVQCVVQCTSGTCTVTDPALGPIPVAVVPNPGLGPVAIGLEPDDVRQILPDEATSLGSSATRTGQQHNDVVSGRNLALRRGATGLDVTGLALRDAQGRPISGEELQRAFDEWSAAGAGALLDGRLGLWANGLGEWGEFDGRGQEPAFDYEQGGFLAGIDYRLGERFVVGGAFGWSDSDQHFAAGGGIDE